MELTVSIDLDNSAFDDPREITLVLSQVARAMRVIPCGPDGTGTGRLMDSNRNTCGTWTVTVPTND
jgi:hypothetical protein